MLTQIVEKISTLKNSMWQELEQFGLLPMNRADYRHSWTYSFSDFMAIKLTDCDVVQGLCWGNEGELLWEWLVVTGTQGRHLLFLGLNPPLSSFFVNSFILKLEQHFSWSAGADPEGVQWGCLNPLLPRITSFSWEYLKISHVFA